jgi:molybdate transport system substrate-binding protein
VKKLALLLFLAGALSAFAQEIRVAAASDLSSVLPEIVQKFQAETHCSAVVSFGSSGNFYQQLQNGAPFDVFLSADLQYPQKLQEAGLTAGPITEYASGKLVLWVRNGSPLDLSRGLKVLDTASVNKVAIANPQHAPYGRAAVAALRSAGVYDEVSPKFVLGENVSQAAVFAQSGNADAGIVPLSLALTRSMKSAGRYVEIAASQYPPIRQAAVAMKASKNPECAKQFIEFLKTSAIQQLLQQFGFSAQ